jgi:guanyl-specific ribonuclease Sa
MEAISRVKSRVRAGGAVAQFNNNGYILPAAGRGQYYIEYDVGQAHAGDPRPRGSRRLVALMGPNGWFHKIYFTDDHYTRGSFVRIR